MREAERLRERSSASRELVGEQYRKGELRSAVRGRWREGDSAGKRRGDTVCGMSRITKTDHFKARHVLVIPLVLAVTLIKAISQSFPYTWLIVVELTHLVVALMVGTFMKQA